MSSTPELDEDGSPARSKTVPSPLKTIFLTGFMGSGKTSVGLALAQRLGWQFHDLDTHIEAREGRTIGDIFQNEGEPEFRRVERDSLNDLLNEISSEPAVVALGGGTAAQSNNSDLLTRPDGLIVFLDAPVEELWARCHAQATVRPLRQDPEHFRNLYEARRKFYTRAGLHIQTGGKSVNAIAEEIIQCLQCDYGLKENSR